MAVEFAAGDAALDGEGSGLGERGELLPEGFDSEGEGLFVVS